MTVQNSKAVWLAKYDRLVAGKSFASGIAAAKRPNNSDPHDEDLHVNRMVAAGPQLMGILKRASKSLVER